jgi:head-tail adaptor
VKTGNLSACGRVEYKVVDGSTGSDVVTWALLGVRFLDIQDDLPGQSEAVRNGLEVATNQSTIQFNYCTDINSAMRVIINRPTPQNYHLIAGPAIVGDKRRIEFKAERVSTDV